MRISTAAALTVLGGSLYYLYRLLGPQKVVLAPTVKRRLPLAKDLNTIEDMSGNYDIDGVSFDSNGVVVSGDGNKMHHVTPPASPTQTIENASSESQLH